jgi:hypothetical protein
MKAALDIVGALLLVLGPLVLVAWLLPGWVLIGAVLVVLYLVGIREEQRQFSARAASRAARRAAAVPGAR